MVRISKTRFIALATGGTLAVSTFLPLLGAGIARADEQTERKSRQYKTGALVLGAAAAYFGLKSKKVVPTIVAGAGAYYAHRKSKEYDKQSDADRNNGIYRDDRDRDDRDRDNRDRRSDGRDYGSSRQSSEPRNEDDRDGDYRAGDYRTGDYRRDGDRNDNRPMGYPDDDNAADNRPGYRDGADRPDNGPRYDDGDERSAYPGDVNDDRRRNDDGALPDYGRYPDSDDYRSLNSRPTQGGRRPYSLK